MIDTGGISSGERTGIDTEKIVIALERGGLVVGRTLPTGNHGDVPTPRTPCPSSPIKPYPNSA